jgi:hypothetical protein
MRYLICSLIWMLGFFSCTSQTEFDQVNVYIYPQYFGGDFMEDCVHNADYTRVHAPVKLTIQEKNLVNKFEELISQIRDLSEVEKNEAFLCQIVIDYIKNGRISKTIEVSDMEELRIDGNSKIFRSNEKIINFLKGAFPLFYFP